MEDTPNNSFGATQQQQETNSNNDFGNMQQQQQQTNSNYDFGATQQQQQRNIQANQVNDPNDAPDI